MASKKIALLSDQHLYHDWTPPQNYENVKTDIVNNNLADLVYFNGDFANYGRPGGTLTPFDDFQTEVDYYRTRGIEVDGVDGNHEWDNTGMPSAAIAEKLKGLFQQNQNAPTISHVRIIGNTALIILSVEDYRVLGSTDGGLTVPLQESVLTWLEDVITDNQDKNIFVLTHYAVLGTGIWNTDGLGANGPGTAGWGFTAATSQAIKDMLNRVRVDIWFSGHAHAIPTEPGHVQSNKPAGYGGTTFVHLPSTGFGNGGTFYPYWKQMELVDGASSVTVKTRDSQTQTWLSNSYDLTVQLPYEIDMTPDFYTSGEPVLLGGSLLGSVTLPVTEKITLPGKKKKKRFNHGFNTGFNEGVA